MARPVWTGTISFGLVSVPVRLFTATREHKVSFHQLHRDSGERIRYRRVTEGSEHEVDYDDVVKGVQVADGEYVVLSREELAGVQPGASRIIEIEDFVDLGEIDPIVWNKTYYLGPVSDQAADKPYRLLLEAMASTRKAAVARFVMRDRQHLAMIRPFGDLLALETMYFADEIVNPAQVEGVPVDVEVSERELEIAQQLIGSMTVPWEHDRYTDTYTEQLRELIERKAAGERIVAEGEGRHAPVVTDLMAALRASVAVSRGEGSAGEGSAAEGSAGADGSDDAAAQLETLSKEELYERAAEADIAGRSKMSKEDLREALRKRHSA